jgi:hypothetical protein
LKDAANAVEYPDIEDPSSFLYLLFLFFELLSFFYNRYYMVPSMCMVLAKAKPPASSGIVCSNVNLFLAFFLGIRHVLILWIVGARGSVQ